MKQFNYGNGLSLAEVKAAQKRWLDVWQLHRTKGLTYAEIGRRYGFTGSRAMQLCVKGEQLEQDLARRPRPPWVEEVWGPACD